MALPLGMLIAYIIHCKHFSLRSVWLHVSWVTERYNTQKVIHSITLACKGNHKNVNVMPLDSRKRITRVYETEQEPNSVTVLINILIRSQWLSAIYSILFSWSPHVRIHFVFVYNAVGCQMFFMLQQKQRSYENNYNIGGVADLL